jgi:hypothetical protein
MAFDEDTLAMLQSFGDVSQYIQPEGLSAGEFGTGLARSVAAGPTFGLSQQLEAAARAPFSEKTYAEELAGIRQAQRGFEEEYPVTALGTEIASGLLLNPFGALGAVGKGGAAVRKATSAVPQVQKLLAAERIAKPAAAVGKFIESAPGGLAASKLIARPSVQAALESYIRTEGTGSDKLKQAVYGGAAGGVLAGTGKALGKALSGAKTQSDRLLLSSFDVTGADVKRLLKKQESVGFVPASIDEMGLPKTIREFENLDIIDQKADKLENVTSLNKYAKELGGDIQGVLEEFNPKLKPFPDFTDEHAKRYISSISGQGREKAIEMIYAERDAIKSQMLRGGDLLDLQDAKVGLNYTFDDSPLRPTVQKVVRQDLRQEIEDRLRKGAELGKLPEEAFEIVKGLNTQFGKAAELRDIFRARMGSELGGDIIEDGFLLTRTTGGAGTAIQASTQSGNPLPALIGGAMSLARIPEAKRELADVFKDPALQKYAPAIGQILEAASVGRVGERAYQQFGEEIPKAEKEREERGRMMSDALAVTAGQEGKKDAFQQLVDEVKKRQPTEARKTTASFKPLSFGASKAQRVERFTQEDPLIQSMIYQESRGKIKAKSRKGAGGLMQIMPKTAKELGVKDVFDPEQSITGGRTYINRLKDRFDDEKLALAAYNWGQGNVQKALNILKRQGRAQTWENIARYTGAPSETLKYVKEVIARREKIAVDPAGWWNSNLKG